MASGIVLIAAINTMRPYTKEGQRIAIYNMVDEQGKQFFLFRDFDRNIDGKVPADETQVDADDAVCKVLLWYDHGKVYWEFAGHEFSHVPTTPEGMVFREFRA